MELVVEWYSLWFAPCDRCKCRIGDKPRVCEEHLIRAKKAENYVEHLYRTALVELFKDPNVVTILKTRELYRHLSNAADHGDEAADVIGDILVKSR